MEKGWSPINNFNDCKQLDYFSLDILFPLSKFWNVDSCTALKLNKIMEDRFYVTVFQHQD